ncbi:MAG: Flp family type IVb pilin [Firmicutes bacterium]|nr:Flp family type IVb pilin [Bacillota bacterium]
MHKLLQAGVSRTGLNRIIAGEEGATAVEYGIMVALIAAVIIGMVIVLGTKVEGAFQAVISGLS